MLKKSSFLSIFSLFLLISCQNMLKNDKMSKKNDKSIENQVVEEDYQTIANEEQEKAINQQIEKNQALQKVIEVQDRVLFDYDSFQISDEAAKILEVQLDWLKNNPKIRITIEGHCDERGTREYNIALGEKRANIVKKYFENNGIENSRMKVVSFGKEKPAFFGTSDDVNAKNRRAVIIVN